MKRIKKTQLTCNLNNSVNNDNGKSNAWYGLYDHAADYAINCLIDGLGPIVTDALQACTYGFVGYDPRIHSMARATQVDGETVRDLMDEIDPDLRYESLQGLRSLIIDILMQNVPDDGSVKRKY